MKKLIVSVALLTGLMGFVQHQQAKQQLKQQPKQQPAASIQSSIERGKAIYLVQCLACHQLDGGGVPHLNAPLKGATAVIGKDKAKLVRIILNGMSDRVEIDGEEYSNNMASHKDLNDVQIADVLTYVRNSWGNRASAVTPAEVKAVRMKNK
ncbi:MAG: hypothetical protein NVSMB63_08670 [Sediminibacterium sp.]